jgi:hypothetical protein
MAGARSRDDHERAGGRADGRGAYADPPGGWQPGDRRRRRAPSASHIYEGESFQLVYATVIGLAGALAGIVLLVAGEVQGLILLVGGCSGVFIGIWTPDRVVLDDSGVLLQAVVRHVRIPWDELESVAPPWWDFRHESLKWRRSRGFAVVTLQAVPDLHRMLVEIERRSPRTHVES